MDEDPREAWAEAGERWTELRRRLRELGEDRLPPDEDVKEAAGTLGEAAKGLVETLGAAVAGPELRTRLAEATRSLGEAGAEAFRLFGEELRRGRGREPPE